MRLAATTILLLLLVPAAAQEGHKGQGHEQWHADFYSKLITPETRVSCCNLADCRPTSGRQVRNHYEVRVNGDWVRVLQSKIVKVSAPDGGFHVCAPPNFDGEPNNLYCVVLPPEG